MGGLFGTFPIPAMIGVPSLGRGKETRVYHLGLLESSESKGALISLIHHCSPFQGISVIFLYPPRGWVNLEVCDYLFLPPPFSVTDAHILCYMTIFLKFEY